MLGRVIMTMTELRHKCELQVILIEPNCKQRNINNNYFSLVISRTFNKNKPAKAAERTNIIRNVKKKVSSEVPLLILLRENYVEKYFSRKGQ